MGPNRSSRRRDRKPVPRRDKHRAKPKSKREIPFGSEQERNLTYFLERLGIQGEASTVMDFEHAIDWLPQSVRNTGCRCQPPALQMTLRKNDRDKIVKFIQRASAYLDGIDQPDRPLLYIEMSGRATWDMARSVREAIVALCANPLKDGRRAHGFAVSSGGRSRWFKIQARQVPKTQEDR